MRRTRRHEALRRLGRETNLTPDDLILPLFVVEKPGASEEIPSLPGVYRHGVDRLPEIVAGLTVPAVLLFGVPEPGEKDAGGSAATRTEGIVPSAVRAVKEVRPDLAVATDVCLCGYTDHGHCGVLTSSGEVDNDATLRLLSRMARAHADAGADLVAPSAMMDGQVAAIRAELDGAGFRDTAILSYATKFASAFYGPFRDAARSAPSFGDRRGYQMSPANRREAVREAMLDEAEGADWLMVKPALPYLDVISDVRAATRVPLAAYQVSGEYAMIKHAARAGALDEKRVVLETLLGIKRAGADAIITYYAQEVSEWIGQ